MAHPETLPTRDAQGYPVFIYEDDCECHECMKHKAMADSYSVEMIARVVRRMHKAAAKMHAHEPTELEFVLAEVSFDFLYEGMTEAFTKWEPVLPVRVN